jgi:hypothetical protein
MQRVVADGGRPKSGPECDVPVEKGLLLLGSIEFQIDNHLMSHGTRIDPETRFFMAQVRDAAGDAATKMLDEARCRLETAPTPGSTDDAETDAPEAKAAEAAPPPLGGASLETNSQDAHHGRALGRWAASAGLVLAAALLAAALLVMGWTPSDTVMDSAAVTHRTGANGPAVEITASRAAFAGNDGGGPAGDASSMAVAGPDRHDVRANHPGQGAEAAGARQPAVAPYRQLAEPLAIALHPRKPGEQPPYPDPRAGPEQTAPTGEQATALAEQRLDLSAGVRREVQRRLALARFDPHHFDGIFGPATRASLREWQGAAGIPATGYLNASALALLREQTADDYRAMQAANKARARQQARRTVLTSPVPQASPRSANECSRTPAGEIVYGEGVRCDFRGLRQSIAGLFG